MVCCFACLFLTNAVVPGIGLGIGILIFLGALLVVEFFSEGGRSTARQLYVDGLVRLASDPTNPRLRREVLELGRRYSVVSRDLDGRGGYPEEAVMRNVAAICDPTNNDH
jgi:hypothetical protein